MLPKLIGDFELQTHILSLDIENNPIHIQYRDKKFRTFTASSTKNEIHLYYADPEKKKLLLIDSSKDLNESVELLKMHCANFSQEALYRNLYSIKERHEQEKFKEFMMREIRKAITEDIQKVQFDDLWQMMTILRKDYRLYDFLDKKEKVK